MGGNASDILATQLAMTGSLFTYASMRSSGFRMSPMAANKAPRYSAILMMGVLGWNFGRAFVATKLGDFDQYNYLIENKSNIMNGSASLN